MGGGRDRAGPGGTGGRACGTRAQRAGHSGRVLLFAAAGSPRGRRPHSPVLRLASPPRPERADRACSWLDSRRPSDRGSPSLQQHVQTPYRVPAEETGLRVPLQNYCAPAGMTAQRKNKHGLVRDSPARPGSPSLLAQRPQPASRCTLLAQAAHQHPATPLNRTRPSEPSSVGLAQLTPRRRLCG